MSPLSWLKNSNVSAIGLAALTSGLRSQKLYILPVPDRDTTDSYQTAASHSLKTHHQSNRESLEPDKKAESESSAEANRPRRTRHLQKYLAQSDPLDCATDHPTRCTPEAQAFPGGTTQSQCVWPEFCSTTCDDSCGLSQLAANPRFAPSQKFPNRPERLSLTPCKIASSVFSYQSPSRDVGQSARDQPKSVHQQN